jgi:multidrug efflux pump subunit AcrB
VFLPSFFLAGVGRQLFVPLSLAVAFAMIASFLLSSSLVPVLSAWMMKEKRQEERTLGPVRKDPPRVYQIPARHIEIPLGLSPRVCFRVRAVSLDFVLRMGTEIFPNVAAPLLQIRLRASAGTRIEQTEPLVLKAIDVIRQTVGPENVTITSDYVGTQPASYPVDLIYLFTSGPQEAVVRIALKENVKGDEAMREHIRSALRQSLPQMQVSFEAGDIISQVMSFGSPTPVSVGVQGPALEEDYAFAQKLQEHCTSCIS